MLKNILAAVGLYFVVQKGYEHYREYSELKREKEEREKKSASQADSHSRQQVT